MEKWQEKLYNSYVSSSQASINENFILPSKFPFGDFLLKKWGNIKKDALIVDLGCGYGRYLFYLKKQGFSNLFGIDYSAQQVEVAHNNGLEFVEKGDIFEYLLKFKDNTIDVILLIDLIEHLEKQELFDLIEIVSLKLSSKGKIVIHCPNSEGIFWGKVRYGDLTHFGAFTQQSIKQLLFTFGFKQLKCYEDKPLPHGIISLMRRILWEIMTINYRILLQVESPKTKSILSQNFLIIAEKND